MENKLSKYQAHLTLLNKQRKMWLALSALVVISILDIIFNWPSVTSGYLLWAFVSCGLLVALSWWYWTMRIIRQLIDHRIVESEVLHEIVTDIKDIKKEVKETMATLVDKSK